MKTTKLKYGDNRLEPHLKEKRDEIIWALDAQGYTFAQIGRMFNRNTSTILRIVEVKPKDWETKWIKK